MSKNIVLNNWVFILNLGGGIPKCGFLLTGDSQCAATWNTSPRWDRQSKRVNAGTGPIESDPQASMLSFFTFSITLKVTVKIILESSTN